MLSRLESEFFASDVPPKHPNGPHTDRGDRPVKTAIRKATEVIVVTADLYRELTLSALRLVPGRR
jgi:hypothetical protein